MFHPHESLAIASRVTMQSAGVGLLVSAVQNALEKWVPPLLSQFTLVWIGRVADLLDTIRELWVS